MSWDLSLHINFDATSINDTHSQCCAFVFKEFFSFKWNEMDMPIWAAIETSCWSKCQFATCIIMKMKYFFNLSLCALHFLCFGMFGRKKMENSSVNDRDNPKFFKTLNYLSIFLGKKIRSSTWLIAFPI